MAQPEGRPHAEIVDAQLFAFVTEHETRTATRVRYPVSVLTVLPQVEGEDEPVTADAPTDQLADAFSALVRSTDIIRRSRNSPGLQLLLVAAPLESLPGIIQRLASETDAHRFPVNGVLKSMTLSIGGASFPSTAGSAEDLVRRADALAAEAWQDSSKTSRYRLR